MLAPGELLTKPADEPPPPERPADPHPAPAATGEPEDEPDSFLMILLRALGAMHT